MKMFIILLFALSFTFAGKDTTLVKSGTVVMVKTDTVVIHDTVKIIEKVKFDGGYTADIKDVGNGIISINLSKIDIPKKKKKVKKIKKKK